MKKTATQCSRNYFRAADILLYGFIVAVLLYTVYSIEPRQLYSDFELHITYNGETAIYPLTKDAIYSYKNNMIQIEVNNSIVQILENDCPDKICIKMGSIKKPGEEVIVCVPNKLIILIKGTNKAYDSVSY